LIKSGISVLYDDRMDVRAGEKFSDADLLGMPRRVVVSSKTLESNSIEFKPRNDPGALLLTLENLENILLDRA
ncbi:MAG: proline--tRNA ligase, partial [Alphaproteobacteria bacterium]|nr:proline--tRNA ligase [Alphaproteobacteria bacterium]